MSNSYKYALDKRSKKHDCPACGQKSFTQYTYTDSGAYVADQFGRCDRENNCNYHRHPSEDADFTPTPQPKVTLPPAQLVAPKATLVAVTLSDKSSALHRFLLETLGITQEHLAKWLLGTSNGRTAFLLRNLSGQDLNIKFVKYTAEGKRDKTPGEKTKLMFPPHYLGKAYLKREGLITAEQEENWQHYFTFGRCFYGEHLWDAAKDTMIVESEKTAVIASFFLPDYNWLATGGNHGLKYEQFAILQNGYTGRIINLVDNDVAGYLKSKTIEWLRELAKFHEAPERIKSINLLEAYPEGWDLADLIISEKQVDAKWFAQGIDALNDVTVVYAAKLKEGVVPEGDLPTVDYNQREYKRAKQVVERIEAAELDILADCKDMEDIGTALAVFGKDGLPLWLSLRQLGKDYSKTESEKIFRAYAAHSKRKTAARLFAVAKEKGIETRLVKTLNPRAAEGDDWDKSEYSDLDFYWPEGAENLKEKEYEAMKKDAKNYNFIEFKNQYFYAKFDFEGHKVTFSRISNFTVKPLFLVQSKVDPKRIFEIKNVFGQKYLLDIPAKAMTSMNEFCVFVESQGNFLLEANQVQFRRIKRKLYDLTKDAEEIKTLGWHRDGFYAFANGIYNAKFTGINDHGVISHNLDTDQEDEALEKHYFIPAMSSIYRHEDDLYESEKKFVYVDRKDVDFNSWAQLFYDAYGDNGVFGMCYYITSLFRDLIYSRFKFFPHLFLFGPPGTGKSTMAWSISYMFGLERKPFMLNAGTAVGFHRTFAQFRNAVVWFDEYSNQIEFKRVQDLKSAYDGAGHVKGEWSQGGGSSNKTTTTPVHSSCMISGQELPIADNALFKRVILLQYHQTDFTHAETNRMDRLKELQEKGLSHITGGLIQYREKIQKKYFKVFDQVLQEFNKELDKEAGIETRIKLNACIIATTYKILENDLPWPFNWEKLKKSFLQGIRTQNGLIANAKETNQFWDQVEFLLNTNQIKEGEDFKIEHRSELKIRLSRTNTATKAFDKSQDILYIRLSKIHPLYLQALRTQGEKKGMDKGSLIHYLSHSKGFIGSVDSTNFKVGDKNMQSSAYCFEYSHLENDGYNFKRFVEDLIPDSTPLGWQPATEKEPF